ncbi:YbaB/EbfC family nucleoid-associated protein [Actinomadura syzygii]|uniref:YbaB/EbfC family nucleoid-associated protein n=1 Tax=Actinomadura syzygii TaxID=1427538 RepID=A0A5D0ULL6_9ACTN|nr:YbaB/EbfC family nucleoid-associated protein [Actinomadura syzygii]TYC18522.1 YbaB/EbfC family nucleoid-associated protein [Actinomadura syzygii]
MTGMAGSELEHLLNLTRAALGTEPQGAAKPDQPGGPKAEGRGEAADGLIRATVSADGEIKSIDLAPRAMRMSSEEIGEHVATAVNAAFGDLRAGPAAPLDAAATERLAAQARELQDMSMRQMRQMAQSISDLMAQLHGGRR